MIMSKIDTKLNILFLLSFLLSLYIALDSVFPPLAGISQSTNLRFIAIFLWLAVAFIAYPNFFLKQTPHRLLTFVFLLYTVAISYIFNNSLIGNRYVDIFSIYLFYIIYEFNVKTSHKKFNLRIVFTLIPFLLFSLIKTGYGLISSPYLSRSIKSVGEESLNLLKQGIGGYAFIYFLALMFPIILYFIIFSRKYRIHSLKKNILVLLSLMILSVIVLSNYAQAIVLVFISIFGIILYRLYLLDKKIMTLFLFFVFVLVLINFQFLITSSLEIMTSILPKGTYTNRIEELLNEFKSSGFNSVFSDRAIKWEESLSTFIKHPLFGAVLDKNTSAQGYIIGVGQHSEIFDTFAFFGLGIGLIEIYILFHPYVTRFQSNLSFLFFIEFTLIIILFFFNEANPSMGLAIFLVLPTIADRYILEKKAKFKYHLRGGF